MKIRRGKTKKTLKTGSSVAAAATTSAPVHPEQNEPFNFDLLPPELKHEVLEKLNTGFLESVCSLVCTQWEGIIADVLNKRSQKYQQCIPSHIQTELSYQIDPSSQNVPVEMLKIYERANLWRHYTLFSTTPSEDALESRTRITRKLWKIRPCDCSKIDECIVRSVHLMRCFKLFVVQSTGELQFFHLSDLDFRSDAHFVTTDQGRIKKYHCQSSSSWFKNPSGTDTDISVCRDLIVAAENPKAILLLQVTSCDHDTRSVTLKRLRRIHLPIWSRSLCLLEDKFFVLYTTGFVGMWNRTKDELSISPNVCAAPRTANHYNQTLHTSKMFRIADLVLIKVLTENACRWHLMDPKDESMEIKTIQLSPLVTRKLLFGEPSWECVEVFHVELWCNAFIVHCQVQNLITNVVENRLLVKRIKRYPEASDFLPAAGGGDSNESDNFLGSDFYASKKVKMNGCILTTFLSPNVDPWKLDPPPHQLIPVADVISLDWPLSERKRKRKLKIHRVRLYNVPTQRIRQRK